MRHVVRQEYSRIFLARQPQALARHLQRLLAVARHAPLTLRARASLQPRRSRRASRLRHTDGSDLSSLGARWAQLFG